MSGTALSPTYASGRGAGERADRRHHAAVVLEVVVAVDDVVLAGVLVLGRHPHPAVDPLHVAAGGGAVQAAAVRVAAPHRVDLGEVGVGLPVAAVDEREQPGAVRPRLAAEDARGGPARVGSGGDVGRDVLRQRVVVLRRRGGELDRVVEQLHDVRERVAEEAADPQRDVDPRAAELLARHQLQAGDATRGGVPDRPHAQQPQRLSDVVAGRAHRRGAPDHQTDRVGVLAVVGDVALDERVRRAPCRPPRRSGTGSPWGRRSRSCVRSGARRRAPGSGSLRGRPARSRRTARAAGCRSRRSSWPAGERPPRRRTAAPPRRPGSSRSSTSRRDRRHSGCVPAFHVQRGDEPAGHRLQLVGLPAVVLARARTPRRAPGAARAVRRPYRPRSAAPAAPRAPGRPAARPPAPARARAARRG